MTMSTSIMSHKHAYESYPEDSVVELNPILDAEAQYGPVFRRELFNAAYAVWQSLQDHSRQDEKSSEITVLNVYGREVQMVVPRDGEEFGLDGVRLVLTPSWGYNHLQSLGKTYGQIKTSPGESLDLPLCPYMIGARRTRPESESSCFEMSTIKDNEGAWRQLWESSEICHRLTAFIEEHAGKTMRNVDQIVCFGLGCLTAKDRYIQHLSARHIANIFARSQPGPTPPVFAQDPIYCTAGISYITAPAPFNFTILDDPEGFRALTGNTFVLSFHPDVPVRQIVMGLTHDTNGPAGMFCNSIQSEGLECDGKRSDSSGGAMVSPYLTCESSPSVWKYKQSSVFLEFETPEKDQWFGNLHEQGVEDIPVILHLDHVLIPSPATQYKRTNYNGTLEIQAPDQPSLFRSSYLLQPPVFSHLTLIAPIVF
ncbi:hypothetical protein DDE83_002113 [Stemphylium lycopersici]|uniref:SRR1-like domain-containing protein n=1 Tax=Stemphylium lycopersici TaxID=183478 RepID=A0A364NBD1_STELY|nr:hypothetical protein DDE83_002113 [Stemphylium lycopersici]